MTCGCSQSAEIPMSGGGSSNGGAASLTKKTVVELKKQASQYKIKGCWTMRKDELVSAIRAKQQEIGNAIRRRGSRKQ